MDSSKSESLVSLHGLSVVVTGVASPVGDQIARRLATAGANVTGCFRGRSSSLDDLGEVPGLTLMQGNLLDAGFTQALPPMDAVVHCAARTDSAPVSTMLESNVSATQQLADSAIQLGCRTWIQMSTISVHGLVTSEVIDHETGFINLSAYGQTKRLAEMLLEDRSRDLGVKSLRLPAVLVPQANSHWPARTLALARANSPITLHNPDSLFNGVVHIDDLSLFIANLLSSKVVGFDAFPLGTRTPISIRDIVKQICQKVGSRSVVVCSDSNERPTRIEDSYARTSLGYSSKSVAQAIDEYIASEGSHSK